LGRRARRPLLRGFGETVVLVEVIELVAPALLLLAQFLGHQKGQLERLVGIEARIAVGVIAVLQLVLRQRVGAAGAFGDVVAVISTWMPPAWVPSAWCTAMKRRTSVMMRSKGRVL
jgi:hypothetical protein